MKAYVACLSVDVYYYTADGMPRVFQGQNTTHQLKMLIFTRSDSFLNTFLVLIMFIFERFFSVNVVDAIFLPH